MFYFILVVLSAFISCTNSEGEGGDVSPTGVSVEQKQGDSAEDEIVIDGVHYFDIERSNGKIVGFSVEERIAIISENSYPLEHELFGSVDAKKSVLAKKKIQCNDLGYMEPTTGEIVESWEYKERDVTLVHFVQGDSLYLSDALAEDSLRDFEGYSLTTGQSGYFEESEFFKRVLGNHKWDETIEFKEKAFITGGRYELECLDKYAVEPWSKFVDCATLEINHGWSKSVVLTQYYNEKFQLVTEGTAGVNTCSSVLGANKSKEACEEKGWDTSCDLTVDEADLSLFMSICDLEYLNDGQCDSHCINFRDEEDCAGIDFLLPKITRPS